MNFIRFVHVIALIDDLKETRVVSFNNDNLFLRVVNLRRVKADLESQIHYSIVQKTELIKQHSRLC